MLTDKEKVILCLFESITRATLHVVTESPHTQHTKYTISRINVRARVYIPHTKKYCVK